MRFSFSRVECFRNCPFQFKLRYIEGLKTFFNGEADNPLIIGTALHTGIETDTEKAIGEYYANYPVLTDKLIEEAIKLEVMISKARDVLPSGAKVFEFKLEAVEPIEFTGFMDILAQEEDGSWCIYDFKYSNNKEKYRESAQLHVYKYFYEKVPGAKKIDHLRYLMVPKTGIRLKKTETVEEFRIRLRNELSTKEVEVLEVEYNKDLVKDFIEDCQKIEWAIEKGFYPTNTTKLCDWCEFKNFCKEKSEVDIMRLPENKRREVATIDKKKIWLYGAPFSGKTYLANMFPDPLMLNTDGNMKFIDAPYIPIKKEVTVEGRQTKTKLAWQVFLEVIDELEKKDNTFKTIVVDLLDNVREECRNYMYDKLGITHESDNGFKAWDMVDNEFFTTIRRLMNLDYDNIILISHETMAKDITMKHGDKITSIRPPFNDKQANRIAGMVDFVGRVVSDDDNHTLSIKGSGGIVFGGGRLGISSVEIPCTYDAVCGLYDQANIGRATAPVEAPKTEEVPTEPMTVDEPVTATETATVEPVGETPETPRRKRRKATEE